MKLSKKILGLAFGGVMALCSLPCFNAMGNGATPPRPDIPVSWSDRYPECVSIWGSNRVLSRDHSYFFDSMSGKSECHFDDSDFFDYPDACEFDTFLYRIQRCLPKVTNIVIDIFDSSVAAYPDMERVGDEDYGYVYGRVDGSTLYFYDATDDGHGDYPHGTFGRYAVYQLKQLIEHLGQRVQ